MLVNAWLDVAVREIIASSRVRSKLRGDRAKRTRAHIATCEDTESVISTSVRDIWLQARAQTRIQLDGGPGRRFRASCALSARLPRTPRSAVAAQYSNAHVAHSDSTWGIGRFVRAILAPRDLKRPTDQFILSWVRHVPDRATPSATGMVMGQPLQPKLFFIGV